VSRPGHTNVLRHHVVALERVWLNKMQPLGDDETAVTPGIAAVPSGARQRRRVTLALRTEVIARYERGMSSRRVAPTLDWAAQQC
jgi:hypothetical protein